VQISAILAVDGFVGAVTIVGPPVTVLAGGWCKLVT
jgi:hypothetical protein